MKNMPKYYLVDAALLPGVFIRVAEAKRALETGECATVNEAAKRAGVSRSAFYKYKDSVMPFVQMSAGRIVTFQMTLRDEPGALSDLLNIFASSGANILTINQNIPIDSVATVTFSVRFEHDALSTNVLTEELSKVPGVVEVKIISGE